MPAPSDCSGSAPSLRDNFEGTALGPPLADGSRSLVLICDDGHDLHQALYPLRLRQASRPAVALALCPRRERRSQPSGDAGGRCDRAPDAAGADGDRLAAAVCYRRGDGRRTTMTATAPRVPRCRRGEWDAETREILDATQMGGRVLNIFATLARHPDAAAGAGWCSAPTCW